MDIEFYKIWCKQHNLNENKLENQTYFKKLQKQYKMIKLNLNGKSEIIMG